MGLNDATWFIFLKIDEKLLMLAKNSREKWVKLIVFEKSNKMRFWWGIIYKIGKVVLKLEPFKVWKLEGEKADASKKFQSYPTDPSGAEILRNCLELYKTKV